MAKRNATGRCKELTITQISLPGGFAQGGIGCQNASATGKSFSHTSITNRHVRRIEGKNERAIQGICPSEHDREAQDNAGRGGGIPE